MATKTWTQTSGNLASTDANWNGGTKPVTGDNILFNATSTANCTWDMALAFGSYSVAAGYSGVITMSATFSCTSFTMTAGTFAGDQTHELTCSGNISCTGTYAISNYTLCFTMTGDGTSITVNNWFYPWRCHINANVTLVNAGNGMILGATNNALEQFSVAIDKTFTMNLLVILNDAIVGTFTNYGVITGTGALTIRMAGQATMTLSATLGAISAPVVVVCPYATAHSTLTLSSALVLGNTLNITSGAVDYNMTLDASASNYPINATNITIGTRGVINGRAAPISCAGTWDSSAGTFTQGTSTLIMTAVGNLKLAASGCYHLRVAEGATTTLTAALNVYKDLRNNGTLTRGANTVSLLGAGEQTVSGYPDTAITVNSTGPVIFLDCAHHPIDTTFTAGACVWVGLAAYSSYYTYGNLSISAVSRKPTAFQDIDNGSGTLTLDVETRCKDLKTSAGATTVQSAGVQIGIAGKINTIGTLTINTPTKILRDHDAVRLRPFPVQFCVNQPKGWGDA